MTVTSSRKERSLIRPNGDFRPVIKKRSYQFSATKLRACLARFVRGGWPNWLVQRGLINRTALAAKTGFPVEALRQSPYLVPIIQEANQQLKREGYGSSVYDVKVKPLRKLLTRLHAKRNLPTVAAFQRRIISRKAIAKQLGIPATTLSSHKRLRATITEFDPKVDSNRHINKSKHAHLSGRLKRILSRDRRLIFRGRLSVPKIAERLKVKLGILTSDPCLRAIIKQAEFVRKEKRQQLLQIELGTNVPVELDPYVSAHRRRYDFSEFQRAFGIRWCLRIAGAFANSASKFAAETTSPRYYALISFLRFARRRHRPLVAELRSGGVGAATLEHAAWQWREWCLQNSPSAKDTTKAAKIFALNQILEQLAVSQLLPRIRPIKPPRHFRRKSVPKACLAEIDVADKAEETLDTMAARPAWSPTKAKGQTVSKSQPPHSVDDIDRTNSRRLLALRQAAEKQLINCRSVYSNGQNHLARSDLSGQQVEERLRKCSHVPGIRGREFGELFPRENNQLALSRLLAFIDYKWGGRIPGGNSDDLGAFYVKQYARHGGVNTIVSYLTATVDALTAALTIYLVDTWANLSVALGLNVDCLTKGEIPDHSQVTGFKARSGGEPITNELPNNQTGKVTTVQALKWVMEMTERLRKDAPLECRGKLFLYRGSKNNRISELPEFMFRARFKAMLKQSGELSRLGILPSMIRPSKLLESALSNNGDLSKAQASADHRTLSTTFGYTNKFPQKLIYERKIRSFQRVLQAVIIMNITDAAKKLGLSEPEATTLLLEANRTGLGTSCKNRSMAGRRTNESGECVELESCVGCANMLIISHPEIIADLIQWNERLKASRSEFECMMPDRWKGKWQQWLELTEIVIEKMKRGPHAKVYSEAKRLIQKRREAGLQFPGPW
jgi:hypothetical protein